MGLMKINQILKKYKELHSKHLESWEKEHKPRISAPLSESHRVECHNYADKGNKLFSEMMKELEGHEVFPKKNKDNKKPQ